MGDGLRRARAACRTTREEALSDMRALTLHPHWAHAVAHLGKDIENRKRPIPPAMVGQRVAIHAGATLPAGFMERLREASPRPLSIALDGWRVGLHGVVGPRIITRAIVATAVLDGSPHAGQWERDNLPPWAMPGHWWWYLADVQPLAKPVPVQRGQLGLWRLPVDMANAVRRAAAEEVAHG